MSAVADWIRPAGMFLPSFTPTGVHKNANITSILQPRFKEIVTRDLALTLFGGISGIGSNKKSNISLSADPHELFLRPRAKGRGRAELIHLITSQHEMPHSLVLLVLCKRVSMLPISD